MYQSKNLSVLSYANGFTLWHYTTEDTAADTKADRYFDNAADMLRGGDIIVANTSTGANKAAAVLLQIKTVKPGSVNTAAV
ncbi:MAG: hypothetical protein ACYYKD_04990 [Rhodospirillales bacterium]